MPSILVAAALASVPVLIGTTVLAAPAAAAPAFGTIKAAYQPATGKLCIRTGWQTATSITGRGVRANDCRTEAEWRRRGIGFDDLPASVRSNTLADVQIAAR